MSILEAASSSSQGIPLPKSRVQSVQRALILLRLFTRDTPEWGVAELARKLKLPKSVVFRLLATLQDGGFLEQNRENQKYRLGRAFFQIAAVYASQNDLIHVGNHYLHELATETQLAALIGVFQGTTYMCLVSVPSRSLMDIQLRPGDHRPSHATAAGKVLLSSLSEQAVRALYPEGRLTCFTPNTIHDVDQLLEVLERARKQGYVLNRDESFVGLTAVAAPIRNYQGSIVAALALGWPTLSVPESRYEHLTARTVQVARDISHHLGDILELRS